MTTKSEDHAGSGVDQPDPKTLKEKIGDTRKVILPKSDVRNPRPNPAELSEVAPTIVPPAD
jgi:hypothetical protein